MNRRLAKLLAALLIAALLMTNVALMEDAPTEDAVAEEIVTVEEPAGAAAEEPVEEEAEPAEDVEPEAVEAVDELVAEQDELELVEPPAFEAQAVEELPVEEELPAEEAPEIIEAEADEAAKLMEPAGEIAIDAAHFPDDAFRAYISKEYDSDGNGSLADWERTSGNAMFLGLSDAAGLDLNTKSRTYTVKYNVHSLQGIEYFPNLQEINCGGSSLSSLDLSKNNQLKMVTCEACGLTSLTLGNQPNLTSLYCANNQLTALDVSGCPNLSDFRAAGNNIASLDISSCAALVGVVTPQNYGVSNGSNNGFQVTYAYNLECDLGTAITGGTPVTTLTMSQKNTTFYVMAGDYFALYLPAGEESGVYFPYKYGKNSNSKVVGKVANSSAWVAKKKGTAKITVKHAKKYTVTMKVVAAATPAVVAPPPENAITVTKNMKYWVNVGTFHQIYLNGKTGKSFKSSNKKVAYVDQSGNIAAVGGGKTKITFKVGKKKRTLTLIVVDPTIPTAVYLDKAGTVAAKVGETQTITAAVPEGATTEYTWKSSNKKVATVLNGVVTFKKKGKVTITCTTTRGKKKAKVTFKVSK